MNHPILGVPFIPSAWKEAKLSAAITQAPSNAQTPKVFCRIHLFEY
jgi:hypothetical protein